MHRHTTSRRLAGLFTTAVAATAFVSLAATAASAQPAAEADTRVAGLTFRVDTGGPALNVRSCPRLSCSIITTLPDGALVFVDCQTTGDRVTGHLGTSNIWDSFNGNGFASDTNINTGVDGFHPGLPRC